MTTVTMTPKEQAQWAQEQFTTESAAIMSLDLPLARRVAIREARVWQWMSFFTELVVPPPLVLPDAPTKPLHPSWDPSHREIL